MDNKSLSHTRWKCQYHIVFTGISLLATHIYKQPLFCIHFSFFPHRQNHYAQNSPFSVWNRFTYFFFFLYSIFYPPFSYKISFTFSISSSSQNFRLTLFRLIPLPSNVWTRRYRYSSLMLKPMIIRLNITSVAV